MDDLEGLPEGRIGCGVGRSKNDKQKSEGKKNARKDEGALQHRSHQLPRLWEAKQEAGKEGKAVLKEKRNRIKALVGKVNEFFKGLGRKVREEVGKLRRKVAGWRKGGRKDVPLLKKAEEEL